MKKTLGLSMLICAFVLSFVLGAVTFFVPNTAKAENTNVASIVGGQEYGTLKEAFAAAQDGDTVVLTKNTAVGNADGVDIAKVEGGKSITLDLNGYTYSNQPANYGLSYNLIVVRGDCTLTVVDTSVAQTGKLSGRFGIFQLQGTLILESGTLANDVEPSEAEINGDTTAPVWMYVLNENTDNPKFIANGGKILLGEKQQTFANTYFVSVDEQYGATNYPDNVSLEINGGEFQGDFGNFENVTDISVSGGKFTTQVPQEYIASGASAIVKADGQVEVADTTTIEAQAVAKIGNTYYTDLQKAIVSAKDGDTIELLNDIETATQYQASTGSYYCYIIEDKSITINGNGYEISTAKQRIFGLFNTTNVENFITIQNLTLTSSASEARCIDTRDDYINLTLREVILNGTNNSSNNQPLTIGGYGQDGIVVNVENSQINAGKAGYGIISFVNTTLTITESRFTGYNAIYYKVGSCGTIELNSVETNTKCSADHPSNVFATFVFEECGNITFTATELTAELDTTGNTYHSLIGFKSGASNVEICLEEVEITSYNQNTAIVIGDTTDNEIAIESGNFAIEVPQEYVASGASAIVKADGQVEVADTTTIEAQAVAKIGNTYYTDLQKAIDSAKDGDTITLVNDVTLNAKIELTKDIELVLDLNDKTINCPGSEVFYITAGKLSVDNGNIIAKDGFYVDSVETADLIELDLGANLNVDIFVYNAVYVRGNVKVTTSANLTTRGTYSVIQGNGTEGKGYGGTEIIVNGGRIIAEIDMPIYNPQNGTVIINDGYLRGASGIEMRNGKLIVNGGVIEATGSFSKTENGNGTTVIGAAIAISDHSTTNNPDVTINGGKLIGEYALYVAEYNNASENKVKVENGEFEGKVDTQDFVTGFIVEGTFTDKVSEDYVKAGSLATQSSGNLVVLNPVDAQSYRDSYKELLKDLLDTYVGSDVYTDSALDSLDAIYTNKEYSIERAKTVKELENILTGADIAFGNVLTTYEQFVLSYNAQIKINDYLAIKGVTKAEITAFVSANGLDSFDEILVGIENADFEMDINCAVLDAQALIDECADKKAKDLQDAKDNAVATLQGLDTQGVNVTTSMITSIYVCDSIQDVDFALEIAKVELAQIIECKEKIATIATDAQANKTSLLELASVVNTIKGLVDENSSLVALINSAITKIDEVKDVANDVANKTATSADLQTKYDELLNAIANADNDVMSYLQTEVIVKIGDNATAINDLATAINVLNGSVGTQGTTIGEIKTYLDGLLNNVDTLISNKNYATTSDIASLLSQVSQGQADLESAIKTYINDNLVANIADIKANITTISASISTIDTTLASLNANYVSQVTEITAIKTTLSTLTSDISTMIDGKNFVTTTDLTTVTDKLTALANGQVDLETAIKNYIDQKVVATLTTLNTNLSDLFDSVDDINVTLGDFASSYNSQIAEITAIKTTLSTLTSDISTMIDGKNFITATDLATITDKLTALANGQADLETAIKDYIEDVINTTISDILAAAEDVYNSALEFIEDNSDVAKQALEKAKQEIENAKALIEDTKQAAEDAKLSAELAKQAAEAALKGIQSAEVQAKVSTAIAEVEDYITSLIEAIVNGGAEASAEINGFILLDSASTNFRDTLAQDLTTAYSEENAQLVLAYYDQAIAAITVATTEQEIDYAVKTFKANVALVDTLENLSAPQEKQDSNSLLLVLVIVINIILAFLVVLNIFLSLGRKEQNFKDVEKAVKKAFAEKEEVVVPTAEEVANAVVNALKEAEEGKKELSAEEVADIVVKTLNEQPKEEIVVPTAEEIAEELVKQGLVAKAEEEVVATEEVEEVEEETEEVEEAEEVEDDESDEDESDDESENDPFARLSRKPSKTFEERLNEADDVTKENYNALKEEFTSYKKVNPRISKKCESFRFGRKLLAKITIRGKSIKCFLALNPQDYNESRYHQKDASDKKAYQEVPFKMSVRSPRSLKRTVELIAEIANSLDLKKKV